MSYLAGDGPSVSLTPAPTLNPNITSFLDHITIILVSTRKGGNIGSVARAMRNMGLSRLKLVTPDEVMTEECRRMAGNALPIVERAPIFADWESAVADEQLLVGTTSSRARREKRRHHAPRELAPLIRSYAAENRVALVFGSERQGLSEALLARCEYLVSIPVNPTYPTLNLAQAVLILAYEVFLSADLPPAAVPALVPQGQREALFEHMERVLIDIGFFGKRNPVHIMNALRRIYAKADLTERDVRILRGILSQMDWYVKQDRFQDPDRVRGR